MVELKCLLQSDRSQYGNATYCMIQIIWHSEKGTTIKMTQRSVVVRGKGKETDEYAENREFLGQWSYDMMMDTCYCTYVQTHEMHNFKNEI